MFAGAEWDKYTVQDALKNGKDEMSQLVKMRL